MFLKVSNNACKKTYIQLLEENFNLIGEKLQPFVWYQNHSLVEIWPTPTLSEPHSKLQQLKPLKRSLKKLLKDLQREEEHLHSGCMVDVIKIFIQTDWLQTTMGTHPALLSGCWTVDEATWNFTWLQGDLWKCHCPWEPRCSLRLPWLV